MTKTASNAGSMIKRVWKQALFFRLLPFGVDVCIRDGYIALLEIAITIER